MADINARKHGDKWQYYFECAKVGGQRNRIYKSGFNTKKEALAAGVKALAEYNNAGKVVFDNTMSFADFLDIWLDDRCVSLKDSTIGLYDQQIKYVIKPHFGIYRMCDITAYHIQTFVNDMIREGKSKSYVEKNLSIINLAYKYAVQLDYMKSNPASQVKIPKSSKTKSNETPVYSEEEMNEFFEAYENNQLMYTILKIGYHCGLRISETLGLTWDDIDFERKKLSVNKQLACIDKKRVFENPKYDSIRTIELDDTVLTFLRELKEKQKEQELYHRYKFYYREGNTVTDTDNGTEPVGFVARRETGYQLPRKDLTRNMVECWHRGLPHFRTHALRHTHCTRLIANGFDLKYVQKRMGHKNINITLGIYTHLTEEKQRSEANRLNALF